MIKNTFTLLLLGNLIVVQSWAQDTFTIQYKFKPGDVIESGKFNKNFNDIQNQIRDLRKTLNDALSRQQQLEGELQKLNKRLEALVTIERLSSTEETINAMRKTLASLQNADEALLQSVEQRLDAIELRLSIITTKTQVLESTGATTTRISSEIVTIKRLRITVTEPSPELIKHNNGVLVKEVQEGPAAEAGIEPNDIIVRLNNEKVLNVDQFVSLCNSLPTVEPLPVLIARDTGALFLAITLPK